MSCLSGKILQRLNASPMAEYVIAFDDSGGDTRFKDGMIAPVPSSKQAACIAGVMIRKDRYPSFRERWQELCAEIAQELGVESVHIHLNQMYGRSLRTKHKGKPNPFANQDGTPRLPFEKTVLYLKRAAEIFQSYANERHTATSLTVGMTPIQYFEGTMQYFCDPQFFAEMRFIREHRHIRRKPTVYSRYIRKAFSILLPNWSHLIMKFDQLLHLTSRSTAELIVDGFHAVEGATRRDHLETVRRVVGLDYITSVRRSTSLADEPLLQLADLVAYTRRRYFDAESGIATKRDEHALAIYGCTVGTGFDKKRIDRLETGLSMRKKNWRASALTLSYTLAREHAESVDPEFAQKHLVSDEEFHRRAEDYYKSPIRGPGVSVLKDPSVADVYRPKM